MTVRVKSKPNFKGIETPVIAATRRTLNKLGQLSYTLTIKELAKATGLPNKKVREHVKLNRANYSDLRAAVLIFAHTYNVASVDGARQVGRRQGKVIAQTIFTQGGRRRVISERGKGTRGGVIAAPWGKRRLFQSAFLIQGGKTAMVRVGKARLPIRPVWGPRITREFKREQIDETLLRLVAERYGPTMKHELAFAMGRYGTVVNAT